MTSETEENNCEFGVSLGNIVRICLKVNKGLDKELIIKIYTLGSTNSRSRNTTYKQKTKYTKELSQEMGRRNDLFYAKEKRRKNPYLLHY